MLSPGDRLKNYEVVATLTEGGMATLVLARRLRPGDRSRLVALKVVHEHLTDDSGMIRLFLDEARVTGRVKHANVIHVEEVGIHEGAYFLVMEYVHGVSLASLLRRTQVERKRLSPELTVYVAAQLCEALHAAHEATDGRGRLLNVVHRDVSPENVLISHLGQVKLIDFGIATSQSDLGLLGKLCYMAPEQVTLDEVDRRTDVYSLGIVLWEALTGRTLFRSKNFDDYRDPSIRTRIAAPSRYAGDITPALDEVVLRALAPNPDDRWESAAAFRAALLQTVPQAEGVSAEMLAAVVHGFAAEELTSLRARLPDDIVRELDQQRRPDAAADAVVAARLTVEQAEHGVSLAPQPPTSTRARSQPALALRFRSITPEELAPEYLQRQLRTRLLWRMAMVGVACLGFGVAIGRATNRSVPAAPTLANVSAAGQPSPLPVATKPAPQAKPRTALAAPAPPEAAAREDRAQRAAAADITKADPTAEEARSTRLIEKRTAAEEARQKARLRKRRARHR